jgi:hypothetical protein
MIFSYLDACSDYGNLATRRSCLIALLAEPRQRCGGCAMRLGRWTRRSNCAKTNEDVDWLGSDLLHDSLDRGRKTRSARVCGGGCALLSR